MAIDKVCDEYPSSPFPTREAGWIRTCYKLLGRERPHMSATGCFTATIYRLRFSPQSFPANSFESIAWSVGQMTGYPAENLSVAPSSGCSSSRAGTHAEHRIGRSKSLSPLHLWFQGRWFPFLTSSSAAWRMNVYLSEEDSLHWHVILGYWSSSVLVVKKCRVRRRTIPQNWWVTS